MMRLHHDHARVAGKSTNGSGAAKKVSFWPLIVALSVLFVVWLALASATIFFLVSFLHWKISSASAPGIGLGVLGFLGHSWHWLARRTPMSGKPPAQVAAEEFLGGQHEDRKAD
jgi:hypothetical protein